MELYTLRNWLWRAACSIRADVDAYKFKDYILPLVFYKRLDDVYADELQNLAQKLCVTVDVASALVDADRALPASIFHTMHDGTISALPPPGSDKG